MKYGAAVLWAMPDWDMMRGGRADRPQPTPDMDVTDGQKLTLGDTTVTHRADARPHAGHDRHDRARRSTGARRTRG